MKKIIGALVIVILFNFCSNVEQCTKSSGAMQTKNYNDLIFDKVLIFKGINVEIVQGTNHKIELRAGANLIDDIAIEVINGQLQCRDNTTCNWVRDYGDTTVKITTPNLLEIYSKTEGTITSIGMLTFPNLKLISIDNFDALCGAGTGDFKLDLDCQQLQIETNHVANYYLKGIAENLSIKVFEGNGKINTQQLNAQNVEIFHRGSNDLKIKALASLRGNIYNVGNLYCNTKPTTVSITEHYRGKLIYN